MEMELVMETRHDDSLTHSSDYGAICIYSLYLYLYLWLHLCGASSVRADLLWQFPRGARGQSAPTHGAVTGPTPRQLGNNFAEEQISV